MTTPDARPIAEALIRDTTDNIGRALIRQAVTGQHPNIGRGDLERLTGEVENLLGDNDYTISFPKETHR